MNDMEDYKEKIKNILSQQSLSTEDMAFWDSVLNVADEEPGTLEFLYELLQLTPPEVIKFITGNLKKKKELIEAKDKEGLLRLEEAESKYFDDRLKALIKRSIEKKDLYCHQKAVEWRTKTN